MEMNVAKVELDCPLYDEFMGVAVDELSTVIYLRRAFVRIGLSHPNEDVAIFSSCLDERLEFVSDDDLKRRIRQSVHILLYQRLTREGDMLKARDIAAGLVAVILLDTLEDLWNYHEEAGVDQDDDILFSFTECMHFIKTLMFYGRPDEDTAALVHNSGMDLYRMGKKRGDGVLSAKYLICELTASDYLYLKGCITDEESVVALGVLHVISALNSDPEDSKAIERDYMLASWMFREVGKEVCSDYQSYVDACSEGLGEPVF